MILGVLLAKSMFKSTKLLYLTAMRNNLEMSYKVAPKLSRMIKGERKCTYHRSAKVYSLNKNPLKLSIINN